MDKLQLVKRCQSGDREALGVLYQIYSAPMRDVVAYYIHNADVEKDVLHDGFIIAFASIGSLKDGAKIDAWLTSIMKNLSLQYLKDESSRVHVPISDGVISDNTVVTAEEGCELTWEELDMIIDKLPKGYGNVFRLAVLDGFSHKEIAAMLGIAPHSSSSQLSHAKALLRRMITKYRVEMGMLLIVGVILLIWDKLYKHGEETDTPPIVVKITETVTDVKGDSIKDKDLLIDSVALSSKVISKIMLPPEADQNIAKATNVVDSMSRVKKDSVNNDTVHVCPDIIRRGEIMIQGDYPSTRNLVNSDWALTIAYAGGLGQMDRNSYSIPNPGVPDVEGPTDEVEVEEKARHHMPLVIGLSVNKSLTPRWSIGTGLRYTFLQSDFQTESKLGSKKTVQRIHYVGVPIKLNYRILTHNGFTLYGQGGGALDIPVHGIQFIQSFSQQSGETNKDKFHIHAPVQWSVEGGFGVQYQFTPSVSLYAEPSIRYYFDLDSDIRTIRQENQVEFTIPIGLRFSF